MLFPLCSFQEVISCLSHRDKMCPALPHITKIKKENIKNIFFFEPQAILLNCVYHTDLLRDQVFYSYTNVLKTAKYNIVVTCWYRILCFLCAQHCIRYERSEEKVWELQWYWPSSHSEFVYELWNAQKINKNLQNYTFTCCICFIAVSMGVGGSGVGQGG